MEKMLTVAEVAEILRVSERTIYNLLEAGNLRGVRIGRSWRIEKEALAELTRVGGTDRQEIQGSSRDTEGGSGDSREAGSPAAEARKAAGGDSRVCEAEA